MTELLVKNVAHLALVPSGPGPSASVADAIPLFAVAEMPRSERPHEVLTSLAEILSNAGYQCLIEVVEPGGVSYRINHPQPDDEALAWGDLAMLLEHDDALRCDGRQISLVFHGPAARREAERVAPQPGSATSAGAPEADGSPPGRPDTDEWSFIGAIRVSRPATAAGHERGWVGPNDVQVVRALVDHAVAVITAERLRLELDEQRRRVENLERALTSNREIGVALGIIMATHKCSTDDAFALLRAASQNSNLKIRDVAAQLAYTGELPTTPGLRSAPNEHQPASG